MLSGVERSDKKEDNGSNSVCFERQKFSSLLAQEVVG
jgi:hypothetical protein